MGGGTWTTCAYNAYTTLTKGMDSVTYSNARLSVQDNFKARRLDGVLNPYNVMRECCDSEEHPNSFPVILALDVTGSMGSAANRVAQKLNEIMTSLYSDDEVKDVEFYMMMLLSRFRSLNLTLELRNSLIRCILKAAAVAIPMNLIPLLGIWV